MISHIQLQQQWRESLRKYAARPLLGDNGVLYSPIRGKSMAFLELLWGQSADCVLDIGALLREGKDIRVFGDPHFEHANIIHMCLRPFEDISSMDAQLWETIANAHNEADMVLCVGDWALKNPIEWQRKIAAAYPGKHVSVVGNHDMKNSTPTQWHGYNAYASLAFTISRELIQGWLAKSTVQDSSVVDWKKVPEYVNVGVSHWPVSPRHYPGSNWVNLHGHTHNKPSGPLRMNASLENINFTPKSIPDMFTIELIEALIRRQSGLAGIDV